MANLQKICPQCKINFEILPEDFKFYEKISPVFNGKKYLIPSPTLCPDCRQQRRLAFRNERKLYHRKCDLCQKSILSMYRIEVPFPVYCLDCWWSDKWDAKNYGKTFDFTRPFFEQFNELKNQIPHISLAVAKSTMENSDFCNASGYLKNCYLLVNSDNSEKSFYGKGVNRCFDCIDCFKIYDSQQCYEVQNSNNCYSCTFLTDSYTCENCHFSSNLIGCKNCFGCTNLRNKEFYFFNQKLSPEAYKKRIEELRATKNIQTIFEDFQKFRSTQITKWMQEKNTENCTGNYLVNCKNCSECFDCEYLEESKYCIDLKKGEDISYGNQDVSHFGMGVNYCYESAVVGYKDNHVLFSENVWGSTDVYYSQICFQNSQNLFGCMGLRHDQYSILNTQYTQAEYEELVPRIIEHMRLSGEWGEFFPLSISPFGYNETVAQEYFPLTKDQALNLKANWHEEDIKNRYEGPKIEIPEKIEQVTDEIIKQILTCEKCGRNYKIIAQELEFYRKMKILIPNNCPDCRHKTRLAQRNPRKLWNRKCLKCQTEIQTTYSPDRPEIVYCENCYLKEVY